MHKFLLQSSLYSLLLLNFISCKSYQIEDAKPVENKVQWVENQYFSSKDDYVYKTQLDIYKNHISGVLIVKKITPETHRVVMTTDFGNKMFDFEISENDFKMNYILPDLDKKMVIAFLRNDFRELLREKYFVSETFETENQKLFVSKKEKKKYYLYFNKSSDLLEKIVYTNKKRAKIDFSFEAKKHIFANNIILDHKDFKITIQLQQITDNP